MEETKKKFPSIFFIRSLIPLTIATFMMLPHSNIINFQKLYLLLPSHCAVRISTQEFWNDINT